MAYYQTCPECGAHLDPGESCDCRLGEGGRDQALAALWQIANDVLSGCGDDPEAAKEWMRRSFQEFQRQTGAPLHEDVKNAYLKAIDIAAKGANSHDVD